MSLEKSSRAMAPCCGSPSNPPCAPPQLVFCRDCKDAFHEGECSALAAPGAAAQVSALLPRAQDGVGERSFPRGHQSWEPAALGAGLWVPGRPAPSRARPPSGGAAGAGAEGPRSVHGARGTGTAAGGAWTGEAMQCDSLDVREINTKPILYFFSKVSLLRTFGGNALHG